MLGRARETLRVPLVDLKSETTTGVTLILSPDFSQTKGQKFFKYGNEKLPKTPEGTAYGGLSS